MKFISKSENQTINLAIDLAKKLKAGQVLGLIGNLGTGKTIFVKGLSKGLGLKKSILSPSFILMKLYNIKYPNQELVRYLIHIDCYRLKSPQELIEIGVLEYIGKSNTITVIEWAEKVKKILPQKTIWIKFKFGKKENERIIELIKSKKMI